MTQDEGIMFSYIVDALLHSLIFNMQTVESHQRFLSRKWHDHICFYDTHPGRAKRMNRRSKYPGQVHQGEGCFFLMQVRDNRLDGGAGVRENLTGLQRESR